MSMAVSGREGGPGRAGRVAQGLTTGVQLTSRAMAMVATSIIFVMLLVNVVDIAARSTVGAPLSGLYEYTEVALVAIVFLGVPYTMQVGGHVAIDSLTTRLPSRWRRWVEAGALVAVLPFVVWLTVASVDVAIESYTTGEVKFGVVQVPLWPARALISVGAGLLAAEIAIAIGRTMTVAPTAERPDSPASEAI